MTNPVRFHAPPAAPMGRVHVVIRLALLCAIGSLGCSSVYWLLYLVLPAIAALLVSQHGTQGYLARDAPRVVHVLKWLAAAYAYLWLLTDRWPTSRDPGPVELEVETEARPRRARRC